MPQNINLLSNTLRIIFLNINILLQIVLNIIHYLHLLKIYTFDILFPLSLCLKPLQTYSYPYASLKMGKKIGQKLVIFSPIFAHSNLFEITTNILRTNSANSSLFHTNFVSIYTASLPRTQRAVGVQ